MDDQNQTNNPLDQTVNPSTPLDITPQNPPTPTPEPVAPPTTTFTTTVSTPAEPVAPAAETTPSPAWQSPIPSAPAETPLPTPPMTPSEPSVTPEPEKTSFTTTVTMPTPTPTPTTPEPATTVVETEMPKGKPKSKLMPVIGGIVALLLVVGVAGAAYYVSNQLSNRQAVAPNAPTSKPAAGCLCSEGNVPPGGACGTSTTRGTCSDSCQCNISEIYCNNGSGCSAWISATQSCGTWIANNCGGGGGGGGGGCNADDHTSYGPSTDVHTCNYRNKTGTGCSSVCSPYNYECGNYCYDTACGAAACGNGITYPTCTPDKRDPLNSPQTITFTKAGTISLYSQGASGTVTLTKSGSSTPAVTFTTNGSTGKQTGSLVVAANETYNVVVNQSDPLEHGATSYGWITPRTDGTCGPKIAEGAPIDANNHTTGFCGTKLDIGALNNATSQLDKAGTTQCWADALRANVPTVMKEDATQDYDFNDFALVFGYEKPTASTVPNCLNITGPATLTVNQAGTYTATYAQSASGGLDGGSIFYSNTVNGVDSKDIHDLFSGPQPVTNGQTLSTVFTPTVAGQYWLRCRAWNDGIAECRPPATVDAPPRFACAGPNYEMLVTVTAQASGACVQLNVYKKVGVGTDGNPQYGTTPLTPTELKALTVGDTLRLEWSGRLSTQGRVRATVSTSPVNSTVGEWLPGSAFTVGGADASKEKFFRYDGYQITVAGQYNFEAQVSSASIGVIKQGSDTLPVETPANI